MVIVVLFEPLQKNDSTSSMIAVKSWLFLCDWENPYVVVLSWRENFLSSCLHDEVFRSHSKDMQRKRLTFTDENSNSCVYHGHALLQTCSIAFRCENALHLFWTQSRVVFYFLRPWFLPRHRKMSLNLNKNKFSQIFWTFSPLNFSGLVLSISFSNTAQENWSINF